MISQTSTWQLKKPEAGEAMEPPSAPISLPKLIWEVLHKRGITIADDVEDHFSPSLKSLTDPRKLDQIDLAVERLIVAFKAGEKLCVYGDFDLDGTSGIALLREGLSELGFKNLCYYQPKRLSEGYGLHIHAIEELAKSGVDLIVTVDLGITAVTPVARANELGVDVVITDHHLPKEELPEAVAIVNPNKGTCESQLGHLCGAGVGFFLLLALRRELRERDLLETDLDPKSLLDCFAIATLTDLVPLVNENRVLVKHGLIELSRTKRPGLKALLKQLGLGGRPLSGSEVAIRFAPKLNALSRMELGVLPLDLYLEEDPERATELAKEAVSMNDQRLSLQKLAEEEALAWCESHPQNGFIWVASKNFHQGVVGLVATKLSQHFNVPAFVGAVSDEGVVTGSSRSPRDYQVNVLAALEAGSKVLERFGGHAQAAGFEVDYAKFTELEACFNHYFNSHAGPIAPERVVFFDAEAKVEHFDEHFMKWFEAMGPYGAGFEVPLFKVVAADIKAVRELRGGHIKMTLRDQLGGVTRDALWFSPGSNHPAREKVLAGGQTVDLLVEPQWNYFAGRKSIQLLVNQVRLSQ